MDTSYERLERFLSERGVKFQITPIRADASTREYYRLFENNVSMIACVYPPGNAEAVESYLDVTSLFIGNGLPVAELIDHDLDLGIVLQEDLGDQILLDKLSFVTDDEREMLLNEAIVLIVRIQQATQSAFDRDSVASRLRFDSEKLNWELNYFKTHYFETYARRSLTPSEYTVLSNEFAEIADELASTASVLCHRDFHPANLMVDVNGGLRIIDHQDARIGSVTYDLVSLLMDRLTDLPSPEWVADKQKYFLAQRDEMLGESIDAVNFAAEFELQAIQRCLKAAGTFSYQAAVRGKTYFVPYIKPMFMAAASAAESLERFPAIQTILAREIES